MLAEAFYRAVKEGVEGDPIAAAVVVETAIHAFGGGGANPKYKAKFRTLSFNLKVGESRFGCQSLGSQHGWQQNCMHVVGSVRSHASHLGRHFLLYLPVQDEKNPDLRRRVLLGEVEPEVVVNMAAEDLASDAQKEQNQEIRKRKLFDANPGGKDTLQRGL